jgi:hypothetical protein
MTPKLQFLQAVQQMRPSEPFIKQVAEMVPEDLLPPITGVAAFELVATLDTLCKSWRFRRPLRPCSKPVSAAGREPECPRPRGQQRSRSSKPRAFPETVRKTAIAAREDAGTPATGSQTTRTGATQT